MLKYFELSFREKNMQIWMHLPSKFCFTLSLIMQNLFVTYIHWNTVQNFLNIKKSNMTSKEWRKENLAMQTDCTSVKNFGLWTRGRRPPRAEGSTAVLYSHCCRKSTISWNEMCYEAASSSVALGWTVCQWWWDTDCHSSRWVVWPGEGLGT